MRNCHRLSVAVSALILLAPGPGMATVGYLMLTSDGQDRCEFADPGNTLITAYLVHRMWSQADNSTGLRFRIDAPASWLYVGFVTPYVTIGAGNVDLSVAYGQCLTETITVGNALWFSPAASPACGQLRILPAQVQPVVLATDCNFGEFSIPAYGGVVNPDATCCCDCHPTEPSTWGKVKALYR